MWVLTATVGEDIEDCSVHVVRSCAVDMRWCCIVELLRLLVIMSAPSLDTHIRAPDVSDGVNSPISEAVDGSHGVDIIKFLKR